MLREQKPNKKNLEAILSQLCKKAIRAKKTLEDGGNARWNWRKEHDKKKKTSEVPTKHAILSRKRLKPRTMAIENKDWRLLWEAEKIFGEILIDEL